MEKNSRSKLTIFLFILQLFTLIGCGKFIHEPLFHAPIKRETAPKIISIKNDNIVVKKQSKEFENSKSKEETSIEKKDKIIVINPGHQKTPNYDTEPIAPGSKKEKAKVSIGTKGKCTKTPEYEINLLVAKKLKSVLEKKGYQVLLTREENDVNISNQQRTLIANKKKASLLIHIHCNSSDNEKISGPLAMCPTKESPYCKEIYTQSYKASNSILSHLCDKADAINNGILETDFMTGINYSKVPVCFLELGYLSNKEEEMKLISENYQGLAAEGIAEGIESYFEE